VSNGTHFRLNLVAHPTHAIDQITLLLTGADREKRLPVNSGLARADVERAFPRLRNAGPSGFVVTGYAPGKSIAKLILELRFDDGDEVELDITHVLELRRAGHDKLRELLWLARASGRRLRRAISGASCAGQAKFRAPAG
jgi:hypothetical protein